MTTARPSPGSVARKGAPYPSRHESAILRRLAQPGAYLLVTLREHEDPLYCYETGEAILSDCEPRRPLSSTEFKRLVRWLVPIRGESLFPDAEPQRYLVQRPTAAPAVAAPASTPLRTENGE